MLYAFEYFLYHTYHNVNVTDMWCCPQFRISPASDESPNQMVPSNQKCLRHPKIWWGSKPPSFSWYNLNFIDKMLTPPEVMMRGVDMLSLSDLSRIFSSSRLPAASLHPIEFEVWFLRCRHQRRIRGSSGHDILLILFFPRIRQTGVSSGLINLEGHTKFGQVTWGLAYLSVRMLRQPPNSVITPRPYKPSPQSSMNQ